MGGGVEQGHCVSEFQSGEDFTEAPPQEASIVPGETLLSLHFRCALDIETQVPLYLCTHPCAYFYTTRLPGKLLLIGMELWKCRFLNCPQAPAMSSSQCITDHIQKCTCESKGGGCLPENCKVCSLPSMASPPCQLRQSAQ